MVSRNAQYVVVAHTVDRVEDAGLRKLLATTQARALAVSGYLPDGPFRGVPLLLKDYSCYTDGDPYYEGTKFLRDLDWRSKGDSYLAGRLRAAGFIFIGKTNLPELASGPVTEPLAFGRDSFQLLGVKSSPRPRASRSQSVRSRICRRSRKGAGGRA